MANKTIIEAQIDSNVGEVDKEVQDLDKSTKEASGGFKGMGKAIRGVGSAIKGAGIAIVVGLLAKMMDVFRQNQKVLDFFNIAMETLSIAFNDLFKFLENNIGTVVGFFKDIFENPKESLMDFANAIKDNLIERFQSWLDMIGHVGKAIGHLFKGEFAKAKEEAINAGKEMVDTWTGVDNSVDKITKTITTASGKIKDYVKDTTDAAKATVELRKESDLARVKVQGLIEEYDRQAEKLRQVRDDESKTFEERIKANNKLGDVLKEQEEEMLKLVDIQIKAAQLDVDKNNNLENQIALEEALNEKKAVQAQITGFQSEQLVNNIALNKEQKQVALDNVNAQLEAYSSLAGSLSSLAGENKALAVASAIIDTYAAANGALAAGKGTPLAMLQAAAIIVQGLANVKQIMAQDVGSGSGGGIPATSAETPSPQMLSGAFTLGGGQAPEPLQAFVVSDDITNNQNKLATIRRRATI
jgi:hypothetical protein|tara:strand:+ start:818 stop:2230 length:1413 start_codon:yes stop_codon:yes gene_type:complete